MPSTSSHSAPAQAAAPLKFYSFALSGHAHRVALMLSLLAVPHQRIDVDLRQREQKRPEQRAPREACRTRV